MKSFLRFLALILCLVGALAQNGIPGTQTTTAPLAPPATNSPFAATDNRYQLGGFGTWATNLVQLNDPNWLPPGRRQTGMRQALQGNPIPYVLNANLNNWAPTDIPRILPEFFGAKGDGVTDDTAAIQATIAYIESLPGGGELVFGPNTYVAKNLHTTQDNRKLIRVTGMNRSGIKFPGQAATMLRLSDGANTNLWRVTLGSATDFRGICFNGNYANQTVAMPLMVIENDNHVAIGMQCEMHLTDCVFHGSSGDGVYLNRNEVAMTGCYSMSNRGNGFFFDGAPAPGSSSQNGGTDCTFLTINSGFNLGSGFYFYNNGGGSGRFINCDSYANGKDGITFDAGPRPSSFVNGIRFVCSTINDNVGNGISFSTTNSAYLTNSASGIVDQIWFDSCYIVRNNGSGAGLGLPTAPAGTYSDIVIYDGPYNFGYFFNNCLLGNSGTAPTNTPKYLIDDRRTGIYANGRGVYLLNSFVAATNQYSSGLRWSPAFEVESTRFSSIDSGAVPVSGGLFGVKPVTFGSTLNLNNGTANSQFYIPYAQGGLAIQYGAAGQAQRFAVFDGTNGNVGLPSSLSLGGNLTNGGDYLSTSAANVFGAFTGTGPTRKAIASRPASLNISVSYGTNSGVENYLWQFGTNSTTIFPFAPGVDGSGALFIGPAQAKIAGGNAAPASADPNASIYLNTGGATRNTVLIRDPAAGTPEWRPVNSDVNSYLEAVTAANQAISTNEFTATIAGPILSQGSGLTLSGNTITCTQAGIADVTVRAQIVNLIAGNGTCLWLRTNSAAIDYSAFRVAGAVNETNELSIHRLFRVVTGTTIEVHGQTTLVNGARLDATPAGSLGLPQAPSSPALKITAKLIN